MRNYLLFGAAIILVLLAALLLTDGKKKVAQYSSDVYGLSFAYSSEYVLEEREVGPDRHTITLIRKEDVAPRENSEGPTAITVDIFGVASEAEPLLSWLAKTPESNFSLGTGSHASSALAGREAVSYSWSGLYEGDSVATQSKGRVFDFSVTYLAPGDQIRKDFATLLETVEFGQ